MACGAVAQKRTERCKQQPSIHELVSSLGENFPKFAQRIGFLEDQVTKFSNEFPGPSVYSEQLLTRWYEVVGRHTTKQNHIIDRALKDIGCEEIAIRLFPEGVLDKPSDDIWEDLLAELHKVDVSSSQDQESKPTRKSRRKKKANKSNLRKENETIYEREGIVNVYQNRYIMKGDNTCMNVFNENPSRKAYREDDDSLKLLQDILCTNEAYGPRGHKNKMKLQSLETCFRQRKGTAFVDVAGIPLKDFLRRTSNVFILTKTANQQWYVYMHADRSLLHTNTKESCISSQIKSNADKSSDANASSDGGNLGIPFQSETDINQVDKPRKVEAKTKKALCNKLEHDLQQGKLAKRPSQEYGRGQVFVPNLCSEFDDFLNYVNYFHDGNYLLMVSKSTYIKHEEALANINWLCVFDFDTESFTDGLFYRIEDTIRKQRGLYPCTWKNAPNISRCKTEWYFIRGSTHDPESKTSEKIKHWYLDVQYNMENHIKQIASFLDTVMPLTVVMLWPEEKTTSRMFEKVASKLNDCIRPLPSYVLIGHPSVEQNDLIELIGPEYFLKEKVEHVFHDLSTNLGKRHPNVPMEYKLPTADGTGITGIDESQAAEFREDLQILYEDNPYRTDWADLNKLEEEEKLFFKGGTLSWQAYYEYGPDHFYEARDLLDSIVNRIKEDYIEKVCSGVIKLYHAPGAGGTTLAQKILWDLHEVTPCIQIKSDSLSSAADIAEKIHRIYISTHLPVIVLMDGRDEKMLDHLKRNLHNTIVVFLCVKRVSDQLNENTLGKNQFILHGTLSPREAKRIGPKFMRFCNNISKKDHLQELVDDVIDGKKHHLIEFGLVTYLHEYTGVGGYVAEYLKLNNSNEDLESFQKVLGYLSLVQVFGHISMPCQLFATMLGSSSDCRVSPDNFHPSVKEFIVQDEKESGRNCVRICHFVIAKEILEQILSKKTSDETGEELSHLAKQNLYMFVLQFIQDLKRRQILLGLKSRAVYEIIFQTFIYRETRIADDIDNPLQSGRSKLSKLLESIPCEQPFTDRLFVLETLAHSFPENASLWAHLGRAYAMYRPTEIDKTEGIFQEAFALCMEETQTDENDNVLCYIYHMYGVFYLKQIRAQMLKARKQEHEMQFQEVVRFILKLAFTACDAFAKSRDYEFAGYRESYGCIGEINVRLEICKFLKMHYEFTEIQELLETSKNIEISTFVQVSLSEIQLLFMQCYNIVDHDQTDSEFFERVRTYNDVFRGMAPTMHTNHIRIPDNIQTRRAQVAAIKLKYGKDYHLGIVDDIEDDADIKTVTDLLEKNFDEIKRRGEVGSKKALDNDYLDWIHVIRHRKQKKMYKLENVLDHIRQWNSTVRSPYSTLYLFILLNALGIKTCDKNILLEAHTLRESLTALSKSFVNPKMPREWLGREDGIRCLLPGKTFPHKSEVQENVVDEDAACIKLMVLKGTIKHPNKLRQVGFVELDLEDNTDIPKKVFFHPYRTREKLYGSVHVGKRVQFVMAFTAQSGYEAYNVKALSKSTCQDCHAKMEIFSIERQGKCKSCGSLVINEYTGIL